MFLLRKLHLLQRAKQNPSVPRGRDQQVSFVVQILLFQLHAHYDSMGFL